MDKNDADAFFDAALPMDEDYVRALWDEHTGGLFIHPNNWTSIVRFAFSVYVSRAADTQGAEAIRNAALEEAKKACKEGGALHGTAFDWYECYFAICKLQSSPSPSPAAMEQDSITGERQ